ncbi:MAG: hypothetical protein JRG81_00190 [Deltaproteobacteria bacterium]|nr:hypothetical protein [Deltaproteobacteria bacterium]MBW2363496.1 hypothetical protein [Deltaproteobacteria bacterium]
MKPLIIGMSKEDFGENAPDHTLDGTPIIYDPVNYGVVIIAQKKNKFRNAERGKTARVNQNE